MTAALSFLTSRWGFAAVGALLLVLMYSAWSIQAADLRSDISDEQQKTRDAEKLYADYRIEVEKTISNNARQHAAELQAALDAREALAADTDRLRAAYAASSKERNDLAQELLRRLNDAPQDMDSRLDARTRSYYRDLRTMQTRQNGSP